MAKHRQIDTRFWDDTYITELDPSEKLLFIYFLTNPLTNLSGCYEIAIKRIAFDTGFDKDMVKKILDRFTADNKILYIDGWIIIINFIKHQSKSPTIAKGIENELENIPENLIQYIYGIGTHEKKAKSTYNIIRYNKDNIEYNKDINKDKNKNKEQQLLIDDFHRGYIDLYNSKIDFTAKEIGCVVKLLKKDHAELKTKLKLLHDLCKNSKNDFYKFTPSKLLFLWNDLTSKKNNNKSWEEIDAELEKRRVK